MSTYTDRVAKMEVDFAKNGTLGIADVSALLGWAKAQARPSPLDDDIHCANVVELDKHGAASNFEHLLILCFKAADEVHRERLALSFQKFAVAIFERPRVIITPTHPTEEKIP